MVVLRVGVGVLLLAHGLVHLLYLADDVPEFSLDQSWLVPPGARRPVALVLLGVTIAGFALLALAVWGVPFLSAAWPGIAVVACLASLALLVVFWNPRLLLGVAIDVAVLTLAATRPEWVERFLA